MASPASPPARVGLLGGGVIGGGWAARFALAGSDVVVYDPDPRAEQSLTRMLDNAEAAWKDMLGERRPQRGNVTVTTSIDEAVGDADFVQESAPERIELKQELLAKADAAARESVVIASSTSGLLPTQIQALMSRPDRLVVGHPFNPVYLLPLVEVCGGERTSSESIEHASAVYESVGMKPLLVRKEIDGFIADRLLEALWREALWLVNDGVATMSEVDDAIRYGAGLRWSFMGTMLTYRIAGGEGGMAHFLRQFGPALQWPWTKLMDVPELTDELIDRMAAQSDEQADDMSVGELEQLRDRCLVSVMRGLADIDYASGAVLNAYERQLER